MTRWSGETREPVAGSGASMRAAAFALLSSLGLVALAAGGQSTTKSATRLSMGA